MTAATSVAANADARTTEPAQPGAARVRLEIYNDFVPPPAQRVNKPHGSGQPGAAVLLKNARKTRIAAQEIIGRPPGQIVDLDARVAGLDRVDQRQRRDDVAEVIEAGYQNPVPLTQGRHDDSLLCAGAGATESFY